MVAVLLFEDRRKGEEYVRSVCENGRVGVSGKVFWRLGFFFSSLALRVRSVVYG